MNLKELYQNNKDFKEYVDKQIKQDRPLEKVLELAVVREYANYLLTR